jgi:threonine synthase
MSSSIRRAAAPALSAGGRLSPNSKRSAGSGRSDPEWLSCRRRGAHRWSRLGGKEKNTRRAGKTPHTFAAGIRVPQAIGDFLILRAVRESGGFATAVSDEAIASAWREVAAAEGLLLCPETAATYAAYKEAVADGRVSPEDRVVLFNCASGLKYPMPEAGTPLKLGKPLDWRDLTTSGTVRR